MNQIDCTYAGHNLESLEILLSQITNDNAPLDEIKRTLTAILKEESAAQKWAAFRLLSFAEGKQYRRTYEATLGELKTKLYKKAGLESFDIDEYIAYVDSIKPIINARRSEIKRRKELEQRNNRMQKQMRGISQDEVDEALGFDEF